MEEKIILQRYIAQSDLCSRRQAEEMIRQGDVMINGKRAELGIYAREGDEIKVRGKIIAKPASHTYIMLNKPAGYTCSNRTFPGEKNIFSLVTHPGKLFSIGRLDKDSRGLILITSDGELDNHLSHPRYRHEKVYEVAIGPMQPGEEINISQSFKKGLDIGQEDGKVRAKEVQYLQNGRFIITLTTGKKRQIRRMFAILGKKVQDLKRVSFAGLQLGKLEEGKWRYLNEKEIHFLKERKMNQN